MSLFDTKHKRKSFRLTTALLTALLLLLFYVGLSYLDPPIESGISVNFGTTNYGSGNVQPKEPIKSQPQKQPTPVKEVTPVEEAKPETAPPTEESVKAEEVVTQDNEESVVIKQQKKAEAKRKAEAQAEAKKVAEEEAKRKAEAEAAEAQRKAEEERIQKEQEAKRKNLDALMGGLNNSEGTVTGSEGDDNTPGDKGQPDGDPYASSYYGSTGSGSGGSGYGLKGRNLKSSDKFVQQCNEQGTVVVEIEVDRSGDVVKATPGVRGTTNPAACLKEAAAKTAKSYKWNADAKAPSRQIGYVVVNFKLGE